MSINFEDLKIEILREHNKIRTNPQSYIPVLEEYLNYFKEDVLAKPGETPIQMNEGKSAFLEAINFLKTQYPVRELIYNEQLSQACLNHVNDIGSKGLVSHESSDGKNVSERVEQHCEWDGACGESIDFGSKTGVDIILSFLVDDGLNKRPQRKHLFNEHFNFVGIAIGEHKEYETVAVVNYCAGIREKGKPYYNIGQYKYEYPDTSSNKNGNNKPKTAFQLEDPDAPDNTVSVKITRSNKLYEGKYIKITKKYYTLEDGTQHIVEIEDI